MRFDASGSIVPGLAERWTVSDDGLSYFRLASMNWPDGRKITAEQVSRLMNVDSPAGARTASRTISAQSKTWSPMTDRVIEINLIAPRTDLLSYLAQPEMAILRNGEGTGPFTAALEPANNDLKLKLEIVSPDEETTTREELLLGVGRAGRRPGIRGCRRGSGAWRHVPRLAFRAAGEASS